MSKAKNNKEHKSSKGERRSSVKTASRDPAVRIMNQLKAYKAGKRVVVTIENPNKQETNKRYIKVLASSVWRDPKAEGFIMR
jgi:ribosomal protein L21E